MDATYAGATLFDGARLRPGARLAVRAGKVATRATGPVIDLGGGYLLPGMLDLQVNGGGGHQFAGNTGLPEIIRVCEVHAGLGATGILPTLITDTPEATAAFVAAGIRAARAGVPGFLGLHLEGPHLDPRRKGAHDAGLVRPMQGADLERLCEAARHLPSLLITVAPESVTPEQIAALTAAGVIVSLGHSDCSHETALAAIRAGARSVTHLFNAMSQLGNRAPGLVGAAMTEPVSCGLIADGIHVAVAAMRVAMAAAGGRIYLVSDCMAVAGSPLTEFALGGRRILRQAGRLTLEDGTLAGADLSLPQAIATMAGPVGAPVEAAFAMVTAHPAACLGRRDIGHLRAGAPADFIHLSPDFRLLGVWRAGQRLL